MERKMKVTVRLSESELAKLDALCLGGSRDGYFRNALKPLAERRIAIDEAAINGFRQAARAALDDGDQVGAAEYKRLIIEYQAEIDILRMES